MHASGSAAATQPQQHISNDRITLYVATMSWSYISPRHCIFFCGTIDNVTVQDNGSLFTVKLHPPLTFLTSFICLFSFAVQSRYNELSVGWYPVDQLHVRLYRRSPFEQIEL